ncbi:MAG: PilZ domain-containing protein [Candidatus Anammoxibacter sp.]
MEGIDIKAQKESETLADKLFRMDIDIGTTLYIEIPTVKLKITSKLVEIRHGERLEASLPNLIDPVFVEKCNSHKGADVVCRYVHKEIVYGFRSPLISVVTTPKKIMILQYPTSTKVRELRRQERVPILLPSKITFGETIFYGSIVDISELGCQIMIMNPATKGENIARFINNASPSDIHIKVNLPGIKNNVIVPMIRKNVRTENAKVSVGLEYNYVDLNMRDLINRFVSEMRRNEVVT